MCALHTVQVGPAILTPRPTRFWPLTVSNHTLNSRSGLVIWLNINDSTHPPHFSLTHHSLLPTHTFSFPTFLPSLSPSLSLSAFLPLMLVPPHPHPPSKLDSIDSIRLTSNKHKRNWQHLAHHLVPLSSV